MASGSWAGRAGTACLCLAAGAFGATVFFFRGCKAPGSCTCRDEAVQKGARRIFPVLTALSRRFRTRPLSFAPHPRRAHPRRGLARAARPNGSRRISNPARFGRECSPFPPVRRLPRDRPVPRISAWRIERIPAARPALLALAARPARHPPRSRRRPIRARAGMSDHGPSRQPRPEAPRSPRVL